MKKILIFSLFLLTILPVSALTMPEDGREIQNTPLFDNYAEVCIDCGSRVLYDNRKHVPVANFQYKDGILYVKYSDIYLRSYAHPDYLRHFTYDENGCLRFGWRHDTDGPWISPTQTLWDFSFSIEYTGDFEVDLFANYAYRDFDSNGRITLSTHEGMNITVRMDSEEGLIKNTSSLLYAKVKDGKITGGYAVEKIYGTEEIEGLTYDCLYRCDGTEFDINSAELIAYMRYDGIYYYVLPPDKDLPLSMWIEGENTYVNLFEKCGGKEIVAYDLFNSAGSYSFFDFPLGRLEIAEVVNCKDVFDHSSTIQAEKDFRKVNNSPLHRKITTTNGIIALEDVGTVGDCIHSVAYPSLFSYDTGKPSQKLIYKDSFGSDYMDEDLYEQYRQHITGIDMPKSEEYPLLKYSRKVLQYTGITPASITIFDSGGKIAKNLKINERLEINLFDMPTGAYTVLLETGTTRRTRKILIN